MYDCFHVHIFYHSDRSDDNKTRNQKRKTRDLVSAACHSDDKRRQPEDTVYDSGRERQKEIPPYLLFRRSTEHIIPGSEKCEDPDSLSGPSSGA